MSVYLMVGINIHNSGPYEEYVRQAMVSLEKYKVEVLAVCDTPVAQEGTNPFGRYVLLKFADQAAFNAWYRSPEYQAAIPIRHAAAETGFFVTVDGLN
jgi:uncharacterized protein (DUF1330 family)